MSKLTLRRLINGCFLLLVFSALAGCVPFWNRAQAPERPNGPVPYHENWCYETLGYAECYSRPQNVLPERLINVDPASLYPPTPEAYRKALGESQPASGP